MVESTPLQSPVEAKKTDALASEKKRKRKKSGIRYNRCFYVKANPAKYEPKNVLEMKEFMDQCIDYVLDRFDLLSKESIAILVHQNKFIFSPYWEKDFYELYMDNRMVSKLTEDMTKLKNSNFGLFVPKYIKKLDDMYKSMLDASIRFSISDKKISDKGSAICDADGLNMRSEPYVPDDIIGNLIGVIPYGKECVVHELNIRNHENDANPLCSDYIWAKVSYDGKTGYVAQKYLDMIIPPVWVGTDIRDYPIRTISIRKIFDIIDNVYDLAYQISDISRNLANRIDFGVYIGAYADFHLIDTRNIMYPCVAVCQIPDSPNYGILIKIPYVNGGQPILLDEASFKDYDTFREKIDSGKIGKRVGEDIYIPPYTPIIFLLDPVDTIKKLIKAKRLSQI